jgi:hypothetical protein
MGLIALAIIMAYAFIWQRIALQNVSADINRMEEDIRRLEKNRDFLMGDLLYQSSLDQVENFAISELGMQNSSENDVIVYSDSLTAMVRCGWDAGIDAGEGMVLTDPGDDSLSNQTVVPDENEN